MPPTVNEHALAGSRPALLALLLAFLAALLFVGDLALNNRSSAPSDIEATVALTLQGLSGVSALAALTLGMRALAVGPAFKPRLVGGGAILIAFGALLAWLPAYFGVGL